MFDPDFIDDDDGPDHDTWTTPPEITTRLGWWDLDPCSNERSTVLAHKTFDFDRRKQNALVLAKYVKRSTRAFINCPYSRGMVLAFVEAFLHVNFCFLLRYDARTRWFAKLSAATELFLFPYHCNFVPPPGVQSYSAIFPHCLFFKRACDATPEILDYCLPLTRYQLATKGPSL